MKYLYITLVLFIFMSSNINAQIFGGSSLLLDGDFDYVGVNDSPELTPLTSTITIETWVKTDSTDLHRVIISKYNSSAGVDQISWSLAVRQNSSVGFGVYESFDKWRYIETDSALISADKWYHISATFDITNQESHIYLDGEEVLTTLDPGSADSISFISDSNTPVNIGAVTIVSGALTHFWNGNIDEMRVWNIARTQSQIQSTMNDTLTSDYYSTADSGLVAYWRCDVLEDLGINADGPDDIRDFSVFQNHGDLSGDAILEIVTSVESNNNKIPASFNIEQNYPNPFNPSTNIKYSVPETGSIKLSIYSVIGEQVAVLVDGIVQAGFYEVTFDASNLPSGAYFYRLQAGSFVETKKMVLMK